MKTDEILPGHHLDTLIAIKVIGYREMTDEEWEIVKTAWWQDGRLYEGMPRPLILEVPMEGRAQVRFRIVQPQPYSTEIRSTWEIVHRVKFQGSYDTSLYLNYIGSDRRWHAVFRGSNQLSTGSIAETAPLAICRAALKAMQGEGQYSDRNYFI